MPGEGEQDRVTVRAQVVNPMPIAKPRGLCCRDRGRTSHTTSLVRFAPHGDGDLDYGTGGTKQIEQRDARDINGALTKH
jgi:hypothetical protein